ncbi:hypothetical protein BTV20_02435 [Histophilus somni]|uniref:Uncharacterized protein n=1 Tax=Histophilus somni TaxID=731 RepID=A0A9Q6Z0G8_HISSO|nr:hypothetical protein [Histophilus somni]ARU64441.1 hypothetical protein BTV18_02435 [Histophilus somni]ARU66228.1 hypothetical protein BTV19_02430 [Histophilus somni]ARU68102.1 hypothetical protein BTV16_02435 [Histophilus somni]ARU69983.1 hypothetical protein BTV20_02435 [Histophilus somni]ARU71857.1 hypothetical protein BTV17_02430 [Histophilus somni]
MKKHHNDVLSNRAILNNVKSPECHQCDELIIFSLQDNHHHFSLSLSTLLECLKFAENENVIPPIHETWWDEISKIVEIPSHRI